MVDRFEEHLGRYPYITLDQVKDYLTISGNTADARLSNLIHYATGVIEHYIGQAVAANNYVEIFSGGKGSVYTARLPLSNVYSVSEFNGIDHIILNDCTTIGTPVNYSSEELVVDFYNDADINLNVKRFGKSSLKLGTSGYLASGSVPSQLQLDDSDMTIEMFARVDEATVQDNVLFSINTDAANYMSFALANQYGLSFESNVAGASNVVQGANTSIESQQFTKRKWAHVAFVTELENERAYLFYNGNTIANVSYEVSNHSFTSNVIIGETFKGYIDEVRVSNKARYTNDFTPPTHRFRPDDDTVLLYHFDFYAGNKTAVDVHATTNDYLYSRDTGEITKFTMGQGIYSTYPKTRKSYPSLSLAGPAIFEAYPSGITVEYRAGYESNEIPYDLQVATLDYIKTLYKQDQERKMFRFEGERGDTYQLSSNFPPHIKRVLDLYRIIH